jgi:hypothetical protein
LKPPRFLHVANGTATTRLIQAAGIPGRLLEWADVLYDGPVPFGLDDEELLRVRGRHLAGLTDPPSNVVAGLQSLRDAIDSVDSYDELVLWYEHDLFDQLNLIQLLTWVDTRPLAPTTVSLVEIGSFPGRPAFKGLGELTPNDLASLLHTRQRVPAERYELAARAWTAFRQPSPVALDMLRRTDTGAMPFLSAALTRFLQEYPWTTDGLSRSERRLLQIASTGPIDLMTAFGRMHQGETAYYITDLSFLSLLNDFSRSDPPAIAIGSASLDERKIPQGTVAITDHGRRLFNGESDRVAVYGIDRWLGGVHLEGKSVMWRWDGERDRVVPGST